jgi:hypothetical protein
VRVFDDSNEEKRKEDLKMFNLFEGDNILAKPEVFNQYLQVGDSNRGS